ncbi:MAG: HDOD domain-containing protein [Betaproteobacteria bacterium]|nr:HDOD domain-containing protein [Betaproteobacteria bacterium]
MHTIPSQTLEALESLELPTPPAALLTFLKAVRSDAASMDEMAELVRREPSLAARILTVANSAAFHAGGELRSLRQSLQVLGMRTLHSVAACLAVRETFSGLPGSRAGDLDGFWRHSLLVAELAQVIAAETGQVDPEEAYLGGLLHDVGQLLLLGGLGARYGTLLAEAAGAEPALVPLEQAALSTDHAAVGAWLIDRWRLPSFLSDAVRFHHLRLEDVAAADMLTRVLWAAHACEALAANEAPDAADFELVGQLVGVPSLLLARLYGQAQASVAALASALGVDASNASSSLPVWRPPPAASPSDPQREGLRDTVASMAALQPLQHELASADSESQLLGAARESARILFGVRDVVFLLRMGAGASLSALSLPGQPPQLQKLQLSLQPPVAGACGRAALAGRVCSTFETGPAGPLAITDLQLARALGAEGLLCVPMAAGGAVQGVMVCPVGRLQAERLEQRLALLSSFAGLLAGHLESWRTLRERDREQQAATADRLRLRDRQVAHEVSNPLGIIKNYLNIVRRKLPDGVQLGDELDVLHEEIDRVARIVRQLGEPAAEPDTSSQGGLVDLNAAVDSLRSLYGEPLFGRAGVKLVLELQTPLAPARADRDSVRQLLLNLWKNAAEALPVGAQVTTSTADHIHRDGRLYTQLCVADNGPGLPADVMASLFKPLGAARRAGHGGMGLSIVHSLVTRLGGHVSCQSLPGRGARFFVLLPQGVPNANANQGSA